MPHALLAVQNARMSIGDRLIQIRERAGYTGPAEASRALGINRYTYTQHENGTRTVPREALLRYAQFYRVSVEWLMTGRGAMAGAPKVPVVHYVGAGAAVYPIDDHQPGSSGLREVDPPPGVTGCIAAEIRGDSMWPFMLEGWLIFYRREQDGVPDECLGKLCVVCLADDGGCFVKTLKKGPKKSLYTLESYNAPAREGVKLLWATRVLDIRPM